jgi:hypothetical protein
MTKRGNLAPIDEKVPEALLCDRSQPDFEAAHAFAPDGIAAAASGVEPIWQRVEPSFFSRQLPIFRKLTLR